jgi:hopanoid biosynthesis associated RND transporter like protein HpnN
MIALVTRLVEFSRRHAALVAAATLALVALIGALALRHLAIDTDTAKLFSPTLAWRQSELKLDREFPQGVNLLAVVIDAKTPDQAQDAATVLTHRLAAQPQLFRDVRQPAGGSFFRENGLLFLPRTQVQDIADEMIAAQPMLGTLAADPSARGVLTALDLMTQGPLQAGTPIAQLDAPFQAAADAINAALAGNYRPLSWQTLLSKGSVDASRLRQIITTQPVTDFNAVEPGRRAIDAVHAAAREEGLIPARGVSVRVTGPVALSDDQLAALKEGAGVTAILSLGLLVFWLALAVRSARAVGAILVTLICGLILCAAVAVVFVGAFNPISIAFAPLFIGIAIDFGIQFCVRYAAERYTNPDVTAFRRTAAGVGVALVVAGAATAAGFLSLSPTEYRGVSDLGIIAGAGMIIALALNLTLLPALLELFRVAGFKDAEGLAIAAPLDSWLIRHRRGMIIAVVLAGLSSLAAMFGLRFDFDPINLENPKAESVQALFDLMRDPNTSPYFLDVLTPSPAAAEALAQKASSLHEVSQAIWVGSFVPEDQPGKLDILSDARDLLSPTLNPATVAATPSPVEVMAAAARCVADLSKLDAHGDDTSKALLQALSKAIQQASNPGSPIVPLLVANLSQGVGERLDDMRLSLKAAPVTLASIPPELRRDWVSSDGQYRVQIFPKGDARDPKVLARFVTAVRTLAPDASGTPVGIQESGRTVVRAFLVAGCLAIIAITLLLGLVLRNARDVAAVLGPLLLAGLLTLSSCVLLHMSLNFANIVTLPLLLGIGVAFDIYFVLRWRAGEPGLLGSPTARAIVFSALTTGTAFGSLALSQSPGMSEMGKLLSIGLFYTLICTLFVLPALLGPSPTSPPTDRARARQV